MKPKCPSNCTPRVAPRQTHSVRATPALWAELCRVAPSLVSSRFRADRTPERPLRVTIPQEPAGEFQYYFAVPCDCEASQSARPGGSASVELRRFQFAGVLGWLLVTVYLGQCRDCGQVYWG